MWPLGAEEARRAALAKMNKKHGVMCKVRKNLAKVGVTVGKDLKKVGVTVGRIAFNTVKGIGMYALQVTFHVLSVGLVVVVVPVGMLVSVAGVIYHLVTEVTRIVRERKALSK